MLPDALTAKYLLLTFAAIWGVVAVIAIGRKFPGFLMGTAVFLVIGYFALGTAFSIRIPYHHDKMEILVYTIHDDRVHALAHPLNRPGEPMHIVFSIDPHTHPGANMRRTFFDAVRSREGKRHKTNIVIDMKGHMTEQGVFKFESAPPMPPKGPQIPTG
ncbi:MAG: hypothetical protein ABW120_06095 [Sedimenticola sp.]